MNKSIFLLAFLTFILLTNESFSQNSTQNLNQVELMKQFVGSWNAKVGNDTLIIWECASFGHGIEFVIKSEIKGVESIEGKTLMGYDVKNGKLLEAIILKNSPNIMLAPCWFTSPKTCEQIQNDDISHPETARWKWSIEFKTVDLFILTETINNKITFIRTFSKQNK
jgi:hypothetical protein